jgi:hypothetical protein
MIGRRSALAILAVLAAATFYYLLVALQVVDMGSLPGEEPSGSDVVGWLSAAAIAAAAVLAVTSARRKGGTTRLVATLAPAAALLMVAYFYTFDSYYLPSLVRHSEKEFIPPAVVFVIAALAAVVGLVTLTKRSLGVVLTGPTVLLSGLTAWYSGFGH